MSVVFLLFVVSLLLGHNWDLSGPFRAAMTTNVPGILVCVHLPRLLLTIFTFLCCFCCCFSIDSLNHGAEEILFGFQNPGGGGFERGATAAGVQAFTAPVPRFLPRRRRHPGAHFLFGFVLQMSL